MVFLVHVYTSANSLLVTNIHYIFLIFSKKHIPSPRSEILINIDPLNVTTQMTRYPHQFDTRIQASIRNTRWKLLTGDPGMYVNMYMY